MSPSLSIFFLSMKRKLLIMIQATNGITGNRYLSLGIQCYSVYIGAEVFFPLLSTNVVFDNINGRKRRFEIQETKVYNSPLITHRNATLKQILKSLKKRGIISLVSWTDVVYFQAKRRVYGSRWSPSFSMDTVGSSGVVVCHDKERGRKYMVSIKLRKKKLRENLITWLKKLWKNLNILYPTQNQCYMKQHYSP